MYKRQLKEEQILAFIRQLGLAKTKARNVRRLAQILVTAYDGDVPQSFEELEALPGVGHKTASVVMAQAFGVPAFPVDTHIHRLAPTLGIERRQQCGAHGTGPQAPVPQGALEPTAPADHLLGP